MTKFQAFWVFRQSKIAQTAQMCNFLKTVNFVSIRVCAGCAACSRFFSRAYARFFIYILWNVSKIFYMRESFYPAHLAQPAQTLINHGFQQNKKLHICAVCADLRRFIFLLGLKVFFVIIFLKIKPYMIGLSGFKGHCFEVK